jgi:guanine deaminase
MTALGELAQKYQNVPIQSHISENTAEVEWVKKLHPNHQSYAQVSPLLLI